MRESEEAARREVFPHDGCPECGHPSVPYEGVPDQQLRGCPKCENVWFENLDEPPISARPNPKDSRERSRQ
jgi:predicted  nucleic acid-binding Zn-ribbon protein